MRVRCLSFGAAYQPSPRFLAARYGLCANPALQPKTLREK